MRARDELATVIHRRICEDSLSECLEIEGYCVKAAAEILAAGYSKPRTITTTEELDALPAKSAILDSERTPWVGDGDTVEPWASVCEDPFGGPIWKNSHAIALPATVLYDPTTAKESTK